MVVPGGILTTGIILALLAASALAVQTVCIRYGTVTSRSADALLVVLLVNVVLLLPAAFLFANPVENLTDRSIVAFGAAGLVGTMAGRASYYEGVKRIGASRAEAIKASQPLHGTLIAIAVLGESITAGHFLSMLGIVVGVVLITYEYAHSNRTTSETGYIALLFPLIGAFFYGIEPTFAKFGFSEGTPVLSGLAVKTATATVAFAAYLAWRSGLPRPSAIKSSEFPWLFAAGLCNTFFLVSYYGALEFTPVSVVLPLVQSSPLIVIAISAFLVRNDLERVSFRLVLASLVVVAGAAGVATLH
ncbi:EamA family transporter [Saliphagus sp. GCM10025334]